VTFTDVFLSDGAMSMNLQVFVLWSLIITILGLLAVIFLSVCIGMSHNIVTSSFSVTVCGSWSYHFPDVYYYFFFISVF